MLCATARTWITLVLFLQSLACLGMWTSMVGTKRWPSFWFEKAFSRLKPCIHMHWVHLRDKRSGVYEVSIQSWVRHVRRIGVNMKGDQHWVIDFFCFVPNMTDPTLCTVIRNFCSFLSRQRWMQTKQICASRQQLQNNAHVVVCKTDDRFLTVLLLLIPKSVLCMRAPLSWTILRQINLSRDCKQTKCIRVSEEWTLTSEVLEQLEFSSHWWP